MGTITSRYAIGPALAAVLALAIPAGASAAQQISACNTAVNQNAKLTQDITCVAQDGIIVNTANVVVDLQGHTITGDGTHVGVNNNGHGNVTIENGRIEHFSNGIQVQNGFANHLTGLRVARNSVGILVVLASDTTVIESSKVIGNSSTGIAVTAADGVQVLNTTVSGTNATGIQFNENAGDSANDGLVRGSTLSANNGAGISVQASTVAATNDRIENNTITGNNVGVFLTKATGGKVKGNSITGSHGNGIGLSDADNYKLTSNTISSSASDGINIPSNSSGTVVNANVVQSSGDDGIDNAAVETIITNNLAKLNRDLGIASVVLTTGSASGNVAKDNGNVLECTGITCP